MRPRIAICQIWSGHDLTIWKGKGEEKGWGEDTGGAPEIDNEEE